MKTTTSSVREGFTLVELLIVISVIAVMTLIAVPAFQDIGRGSKMNGAVRELYATLNLARQWAITHRENTYVVFPDDFNGMYGGLSTNEHKKALRSYAVYTEGKGYVTEWRFLPAGIYFIDTNNSDNDDWRNEFEDEILPGKDVFRIGSVEQIPFPDSDSPDQDVNCLVFEPTGSLTLGAIGAEIYIAEAVALDGAGSQVIRLVWKENPVMRGINVSGLTGLTKIIDYAQTDDS